MKTTQQIIEDQRALSAKRNAESSDKNDKFDDRAWILSLANQMTKALKNHTYDVNQKDYEPLIRELKAAISAIPKTEEVSVNNLKDYDKKFDRLEKAIKAIKMSDIVIPEVVFPKSFEVSNLKEIKFPEIKFPEIPKTDLTVLEKGIKSLEKAYKASLGTEDIKTQKALESVLKTVQSGLSDIDKTLQEIKNAPKEVPVDRTNDIIKSQKKITDAINGLVFPVANFRAQEIIDAVSGLTFDTSMLATEATLQSINSALSGGSATSYKLNAGPEETGGYLYIGYQGSDGSWYIKRKDTTTLIWTFAKGTSGFSTAWTNKASQSYSDWDTNNVAEAKTTATTDVKPRLVDENGVESQMLSDNYFAGAPVVIDSAHHEIHCGDMVSLNHTVDLGNGATRDILIVTPNPAIATKRYHFKIEVITESEADYKLYEDTTVSNNGTTLSARNRNRQNPVVAENEVGFYHTPTVTGVGTLIGDLHWGSGKGVGGDDRGMDEWVFKNNAKYLIRVNNATTSNNYITIRVNYYVHPGV